VVWCGVVWCGVVYYEWVWCGVDGQRQGHLHYHRGEARLHALLLEDQQSGRRGHLSHDGAAITVSSVSIATPKPLALASILFHRVMFAFIVCILLLDPKLMVMW
jgi:hypothetical protein